jgi:hypothetical protein
LTNGTVDDNNQFVALMAQPGTSMTLFRAMEWGEVSVAKVAAWCVNDEE